MNPRRKSPSCFRANGDLRSATGQTEAPPQLYSKLIPDVPVPSRQGTGAMCNAFDNDSTIIMPDGPMPVFPTATLRPE